MRVNKCDYCGTETRSTSEWLFLERPWGDQNPAGGMMMVGKEQLEFCSPQCVIDYLTKEQVDYLTKEQDGRL